MKKTSKEVSEIVGLSCRMIQELEKKDKSGKSLAEKPKEKNKYGHLQYGEKEIERLWQLKFYKELGYERPEIEEIEANNDRTEILDRIIKELNEKREKIDNMISLAEMMKETGLETGSFKFGLKEFEQSSYDELTSVLGTSFKVMGPVCKNGKNCTIEIDDDEFDELVKAFERIVYLYMKNVDFTSSKVQDQISVMQKIISEKISDSNIFFRILCLQAESDKDMMEDLDEEYGNGIGTYFGQALKYYCNNCEPTEVDKMCLDAVESIIDLGRLKYRADSQEVQAEVKQLHQFFEGIKILSKDARFEMFKRFGELFNTKAYKDAIDNGAAKGKSWFIYRAVQIYCDRNN